MYTYKSSTYQNLSYATNASPNTHVELTANGLLELLFLMYISKVITKEQFEDHRKHYIELR